MNWRGDNGRLKEMSCRVALLRLCREGKIELPAARPRPPSKRERGEAWDESLNPPAVAGELKDLGEVELIKVPSAESPLSRTWNELMDRHHYLESGPLCGAQMRYLIRSSTVGWIGGFAFSAAAWRLKSREEWIGWTDQAREQNLKYVVCNSRFLICPQIKVPNLASHVLALSCGRISGDWKARYGYEPMLVETFVEKGRYKGTSYQAANWTYVGASQGRGRQDANNRYGVGVKDIYIYPLVPDVRVRLCAGGVSEAQPEPEEARTSSVSWAEEEFGQVPLEDERLQKRLLRLADDFYARPQASVPEACGSRSKTKAAYRFFEHERTNLETLLESHYRSTEKRVKQEKVVLAVQDTTSLNYATHKTAVGLGPISHVKGAMGLEVHDTMAFTLEGTPLGLLDVQCWARDPKEFGKKKKRHKLPIEQKESYKWLASFQAVSKVQRGCPTTTLVSVGDREADIYELFELALKDSSGPKLLVRVMQNRGVAGEHYPLWETMAQKSLAGTQMLRVPRQGSRLAREAALEVRFSSIKLKPPQSKPGLGELNVWVVLAEEREAPEGVEPLQWMLLSTMEIQNFQEAVEKLSWYARRWGIEVYHKTLKSGCKVEERRLGTADRIEACLAIDMVVAWRIFHLTKLGRETPEVPCTVFFEEAEWKALVCRVTQNPVPPSQPPTLREAVRMVASLGGFLGRKGDGEPGTQSLWIGLQRLDDIAATWKFVVNIYAPHLLSPPVSSNPSYG